MTSYIPEADGTVVSYLPRDPKAPKAHKPGAHFALACPVCGWGCAVLTPREARCANAACRWAGNPNLGQPVAVAPPLNSAPGHRNPDA